VITVFKNLQYGVKIFCIFSTWAIYEISLIPRINSDYFLEKKNQLDATEWFIALIICSTSFGQLYAQHQELETTCVLLPPLVCFLRRTERFYGPTTREVTKFSCFFNEVRNIQYICVASIHVSGFVNTAYCVGFDASTLPGVIIR
jgi:hypothetical protein